MLNRKVKEFSSSQEDLLERLVLKSLAYCYYKEHVNLITIKLHRIFKRKVTFCVTLPEEMADEYVGKNVFCLSCRES